MKSSQKKLGYLLMMLFVLGAVLSILNLLQLPGALERVSVKIDLSVMEKIRPVVFNALAWVGGTLLSGFLLLILHFTSQSKKQFDKGISVKLSTDEEQSAKEVKQDIEKQNSLEKRIREVEKKVKQVKGFEKRAGKYISAVSEQLEASQGLLYLTKKDKEGRYAEMISGYAFTLAESEKIRYEFGDGLVGQVAKDGKAMNICDIPEGYIKIISGLGSSSPTHLLIIPIKHGDEVVAVVELASFKAFTEENVTLVNRAFTLLEKEMPGHTKKNVSVKKAKETVKTSGKN
jgi:putative methionine-R-sulfoxide reductase with GAF domain